LLNNYLNQSLTWSYAGTPSEYNESTYTTSTIKGRMETGFKLIRNAQGQEVISSAVVFTRSAVQNNDLINNRRVISVESMVDLDGSINWYEVYVV
jgi:hypothetical protein